MYYKYLVIERVLKMIDKFKELQTKDYELNLPIPKISVKEIILTIEKNSIYKNSFEIWNTSEGKLKGYLETKKAIVKPITINFEKDSTIHYSINTSQLHSNRLYEDSIIITYNGGEIIVPFKIYITEKKSEKVIINNESNKPTIIKKKKKYYSMYFTEKSYNLLEKGKLIVNNYTDKKMIAIVECKQNFVIVDRKIIEIDTTGTFEFDFKITLLDKLFSIIPPRKNDIPNNIKNKPEVNWYVDITLANEYIKKTFKLQSSITLYESIESNNVINNNIEYKNLLIKTYDKLINSIINNNRKELNIIIENIESILNYNKQNIYMRLLYVYLLIETNKKKAAKNQLNFLLKYKGYYSTIDYNIIEILECLNRISSNKEISKLKLNIDNSWQVLMLINKSHGKYNIYNECKKIYRMGTKNTILLTLAANYLNKHPFVPNDKDKFYKVLLNWVVNKNIISGKWKKEIERGYYKLVKYDNIYYVTALKLYKVYGSTNLHKLFCQIAIANDCHNEVCYQAHYNLLKNRRYIEKLDVSYASCCYKLKINIDFKLVPNILSKEINDKKLKKYIYASLIKQKECYNSLIILYKANINDLAIKIIEEIEYTHERIIILEYYLNKSITYNNWKDIRLKITNNLIKYLVEIKSELLHTIINFAIENNDFIWVYKKFSHKQIINYIRQGNLESFINNLVKEKEYMTIYNYYERRYLDQLPKEYILNTINQISKYRTDIAYKISYNEYIQGNYDKISLNILVNNFTGTLEELIKLYKLTNNNTKKIQETILYKGFITRKQVDDVLEVYISYRNKYDNSTINRIMDYYFSAQILIEDFIPTKSYIEILEEIVINSKEKDSMPIELALLKSYSKINVKNKDLAIKLVKKYIKNGIIFPWYFSIVNDEELELTERTMTYFEYNSKSSIRVNFYYKFDYEKEYTKIKMRHIVFGLYTCKIVIFYNEVIQYYIQEETREGKKDIKISNIYLKKDVVNREDLFNKFDIINTIQMSLEVLDEESIEESIKEYLTETRRLEEFMNIM